MGTKKKAKSSKAKSAWANIVNVAKELTAIQNVLFAEMKKHNDEVEKRKREERDALRWNAAIAAMNSLPPQNVVFDDATFATRCFNIAESMLKENDVRKAQAREAGPQP